MDEHLRSAVQRCSQFIEDHPDYSISSDPQPSQGVNNQVVHASWRGMPVIFKYFREPERRERELFGLRYWADTGLVPDVIDDSGEDFLIVSEITGAPLPAKGTAPGDVDTVTAGGSLGRAVAKLSRAQLTAGDAAAVQARFYAGQTIEAYVRAYMNAAKLILQSVALYQTDQFSRSTAFMESQWDALFEPARILFHQDAAVNVHFADGQVSGFFDLETCRIGTHPMQIGSLLVVFGRTDARWSDFVRGYEAQIGRPLNADELSASVAFGHFTVWRSVAVNIMQSKPQPGQPLALAKTDEQRKQDEHTAFQAASTLSFFDSLLSASGVNPGN